MENTLPQFITANINAVIPNTSDITHVRFNDILYSTLVKNAVLTAQLVQEIPSILSNTLEITPDDIIVLTITQSLASSVNVNQKKRSVGASDGVLVTMALPKDQVQELQSDIYNASSALYQTSNGQLPTFIDRTYNITSLAAVSPDTSSGTINNPNGDTGIHTNNGHADDSDNADVPAGGSKLSKGSIIGICIGVGACVYVAATVVGVKVYRNHKKKKEDHAIEQHMIFADSISSPVLHEDSLGWTGTPYQRNQIHMSHLSY
ncbi:hypothetical protein EDC96DRAFT_497245 [Choanephora cucurbitarum]|nr:hypothetical protein EDC96DRAFT_497245 [Choanephora cucurbitarum]